MNKRIFSWVALLLPLFVSAQAVDTTIRKVHIGFLYSQEIFPENWRTASVNASGQAIENGETRRCKNIIALALNKYPEAIFTYNLKSVFFLKSMQFFGVGFGGTNSADAVYLSDQGVAAGYTDKYLEQTFHHEFSSILLRNYTAFLDTNAWKANNAPGFRYNDPENGVGAIRQNQTSQELDSLLCQKGVLTEYGGSSLENDVNTFAQNLFCPEKNFWAYVAKYPHIYRKTKLLIRFYSRISEEFSEAYFRSMAK
jgi:hypothetical protein